MKRITCRELGEKLGVSHVTISRALRNHPSVSQKTRERVRALAAKMGYRPDPALGALNAYRQANKKHHYQATLAWIYPIPEFYCPKELLWIEPVRQYAETLGFKLEPFWAATYDDWMRLARTLKARNIQGLIRTPTVQSDSRYKTLPPFQNWIPQNPATWPWRDFPWEDFCTICLGRTVGPSHHQVNHRQTQGAALALSNLVALGYRKIGIVLHAIKESKNDYEWLAGYLSKCVELKQTPLYLADEHSYSDPHYVQRVAKWLRRHRPDAVIAPGDGDLMAALHLAKLETPKDIAVVFLSVMPDYPQIAAIDQNYEIMVKTAINQLVDLIRRNERGIPSNSLRYLVEGTWQPGVLTPPARANTADSHRGR